MTDNDARLARIESRLVQLMLHMGLNPYEKQYDANHKPITRTDTRKRNSDRGRPLPV